MKLLKSALGATVLGVLLFFGATAFMMSKIPKVEARHEAARENESHTTGPSWNFHNPEMDQLIEELKKERDQLGTKEKQLKEWETRVQAERVELDEATRTIKKIQADMDQNIVRVKEDEAANLKKLAKMYASMEPAGAAAILRELEDGVVVKIMTFMKDAETGPVLDALSRRSDDDTRRAARISEYLRLSAGSKSAAKK